ncbi:MAG: peptidylprolyl isomerase [Trueperaceae bacterium]|jgi:peptidylprolyl isomerase|nr:peptidylprolyl isomerase [Trueperaceae bacterium]
MSEAKSGDTVHVHYTGTLDDGTVFDSSEGRDPLTVTLGSGQVIPGFEAAVVGMSVGETKKARLEPHDAYGERRDDLMLDVPRSDLPEDLEVELGTPLQLQQEDGQAVPVTVAALDDTSITLDANPPLAGQALTFEMTLVDLQAG